MKKRREAAEAAAANQWGTAAVWGARARLGRVLGRGLAAARVRGLGARMGARAQQTLQVVQVWKAHAGAVYMLYILFYYYIWSLWASLLELQQRYSSELVATHVHWHPVPLWMGTGLLRCSS